MSSSTANKVYNGKQKEKVKIEASKYLNNINCLLCIFMYKRKLLQPTKKRNLIFFHFNPGLGLPQPPKNITNTFTQITLNILESQILAHTYLCIHTSSYNTRRSRQTVYFYGFLLFLIPYTKNMSTSVLIMMHLPYGMPCLMTSNLLPF